MTAKKTGKKATGKKANAGRVTAPKKAAKAKRSLSLDPVDLSAIEQFAPGDLPSLSMRPEPPKWNAKAMLDAKRDLIHDVTICLDSDYANERHLAEGVLKAARELAYAAPENRARWETVAEAINAYNAAVAAAAAHSVKFVARAMPRPEYDELCRLPQHRPTKHDQDMWREKCEREGIQYKPLSFQPDAFPPALMAQCMVEPELELEDAIEIWETWSDAEAGTVFDLCVRTQKIVY